MRPFQIGCKGLYMKEKDLHKNTKKVVCKCSHTCSKCGKKIVPGETAYRTNPKFIEPFYRCEKCKPTKKEVTEMIQDEMSEYFSKDYILIED